MDYNNEAVAAVTKAVKQFYDRKEGFRIYHGSTNSTRVKALDSKRLNDTTGLSHVISIDIARKSAIVEPNVPMDQLVGATLKHNLIPPVVPEFPGITVGGSFSGTAGESGSFKCGFFYRTVNRCEIVLANAEISKASPSKNSDLFYGATGALRTLGIITLFEVQLIQAGDYVELTYLPESCDFLDGILFTPTHGVIIIGRIVNKTSHKVQRFTHAHDPWFYLHASNKASSSSLTNPAFQAVPIKDYLFRYDCGAFWMGSYSFNTLPFNRLTRFLLDPLMHARKMYQDFHAMGNDHNFIIQDLAIPGGKAGQFLDFLHDNFDIYPLWLCPIRAGSQVPVHALPHETEFILNVGLWGPPCEEAIIGNHDAFMEENKVLERKVSELGDLKWLYANVYYTEKEFGLSTRGSCMMP
ncbi:hypothetical protein MMC14_000561 [Varicellaria rhodocarpa]|nr:hypothetical protein [Varicellaria rhodocarpa]